MDQADELATVLGDTITFEFFRVLGIQDHTWLCRSIQPLIRKPIQNFAGLAASFDRAVGELGLQAAAQQYLRQYLNGFEFSGADQIPAHGPTIVAANHPGSVDGMLLLAGIARTDIRAIASGAPFLKSFPNFSRYLLFSTGDPQDRFQALRGAYRHLQRGGCLVTFPTGLLDPDPAFMPGAPASFDRWHASLALLIKKVPATCLVPVVISGVLEPRYYHHPVAKLFRDPIRRQKFSEYMMAIQILRRQGRFNLTPQVSFGRPMRLPETLLQEQANSIVMAAITDHAKTTLAAHTERLYPQPAR